MRLKRLTCLLCGASRCGHDNSNGLLVSTLAPKQ